MSDTPDEPAATDPVPLYAISEVALDEINEALMKLGVDPATLDQPGVAIQMDSRASRAVGFINAARENGPIQDDPAPLDFEDMVSQRDTETRARAIATRQRDFLMGQVDSLIQRLSGAHVAAGLLAMPAAQGFAQKEVFPINQVLAQIEQAEANQ